MLASISLLIFSPVTFAFDGGNDQDLVNALGTHLKRPIVMLSEYGRTWSKASVEYVPSEERSAQQQLEERLGLEISQKADGGISSKAWPYFFYRQWNRRPVYQNRFGAATVEKSAKDGRLLVATSGPVPLERIFPEGMRSVTWHWFLNGSYVVAKIQGASESEFVAAVADAIGAKVEQQQDSFYLDVNPKAYRKRAIALMEQSAKSDQPAPGMKHTYLLTSKYLSWASDDQLVQLLSRPDHRIVYDQAHKNTQIKKAAFDRVEAQWAQLKDRLDFDWPFELMMTPDGLASTKFKEKNKEAYHVF